MTLKPLSELLAPDWAEALEPELGSLRRAGEFLGQELREGRGFLPATEHILRSFQQPMAKVRVLIVGQDPYPTPGHAIGLSFAVDRRVRPLPRSLANIYRELESDLGVPAPSHGDLSQWVDQGVMLLNRVLSVRPGPGQSGSHRGQGWEEFTAGAISALAKRGGPLVAVLWGRDAMGLAPMLGSVPTVQSPHPSPLSASRGFFGSRPFSRLNALLEQQGATPVNWQISEH